jgi:hypothetical protein
MTVAREVVGEADVELAVATSLDREDGLAGPGCVAEQAARVTAITAVPKAMNVRGILPT